MLTLQTSHTPRRRRPAHQALAVLAAIMVTDTGAARASLTSSACLAKKLKEWGTLRKCQAIENGKRLQGKPFYLANCQTRFDQKIARLTEQAAKAAVFCRYTDNGDGTATDYDTGLQWEQKNDLDNVPNPANPHDADNAYSYTAGDPQIGWLPSGTVFTDFLRRLNHCVKSGETATGGFAGYCDWRLPSFAELNGIFDLAAPGCDTFATGPCIDQSVFGPTAANYYWSGTGVGSSVDPDIPVIVAFARGAIDCRLTPTTIQCYARAVRSAL